MTENTLPLMGCVGGHEPTGDVSGVQASLGCVADIAVRSSDLSILSPFVSVSPVA